MLGTFVLSQEYYDAYYTKAQKARRMLLNDFDIMFNEADFLLTPTTPNTAFKLNELQDPIKMYSQDIFTVTANLVGAPAISLPLFKHSDGLPFGTQIMSARFNDAKLLQFSKYIESNYGYNI